jgi:hypothetical protein
VKKTIFLEGGGDSKELHARCREWFRKLLESCGFVERMPRLIACGGRESAHDAFKTAHANNTADDFIAMWIDSEDPLRDVEETWQHLKSRDDWDRPRGAEDEQVLLMTTCMETWIVCDRTTLAEHFGDRLQESALPALVNMEERPRDATQSALIHASRKCPNAYTKGKQSFELLGKLDPAALDPHLPSFRRARRILSARL